MASYPPDTRVLVRPFEHRANGDEVTIGDVDRQVFLAIPAEGLDILNDLADGKTVGEAVRNYEEKYDETPDIEDFLKALGREGFVEPSNGSFVAPSSDEKAESTEASSILSHAGHVHSKWNFNWIPVSLARKLVSAPVLVLYGILITVGVVLIVNDTSLIPGPRALLFEGGHFALFTWITFGWAVISTLIHELGHAVAARAVNARATLGIGNLMYTMVAQTDITAVHMATKRQRYLAYMYGMLVDGASAGIVVMLLWGGNNGLYTLPGWATVLGAGILLTYAARISFQMFFYVRTDLYYTLATYLNAKDLLTDTETFLKNLVNRVLFRKHKIRPQTYLSKKERRGIRIYSLYYVFGRGFSLMVLFTYYLPLMFGYLYEYWVLATGGTPRFNVWDFITISIILFFLNFGGIYLWIKNYAKLRKQRRHDALAAAV